MNFWLEVGWNFVLVSWIIILKWYITCLINLSCSAGNSWIKTFPLPTHALLNIFIYKYLLWWNTLFDIFRGQWQLKGTELCISDVVNGRQSWNNIMVNDVDTICDKNQATTIFNCFGVRLHFRANIDFLSPAFFALGYHVPLLSHFPHSFFL